MRNPYNETAICHVLNYMDEVLFEPKKLWDEDIFEEQSWSRWAAYEIFELLADHPDDFPDTIVESFYDKMWYYHDISPEGSKQQLRFGTAMNVAYDLLDIIYMLGKG